MSIVAFQGDEIELTGLREIEDLNVMVPNLAVNGTQIFGDTGTAINIRGIPNVAIYVDGVETSGNNLLMREFLDMERIEVLRGPQGTLFGRGSMGGAIQFISTRPGDEFGGKVQATSGIFSRTDIKASIDVPLSDTLKTRLSGAILKRDGYIKNLEPEGADGGDVDDRVLRADILWEPSEQFSARAIWNYTTYDRDGDSRVTIDVDTNPPDFSMFPPSFTFVSLYPGFGFAPITEATDFSTEAGIGEGNIRSSRNQTGANTMDQNQFILDLNWDFTETMRFRSITGYRTTNTRNWQDTDGTRYLLLDEIFYQEDETLSQEFQLLGSTDNLDWVAGFYYRDSEGRDRRIGPWNGDIKQLGVPTGALFGFFPLGAVGNNFDGYDNKTTAFFGEVTWSATEKLEVTLGLRYNEDDNHTKTFNATNRIGPGLEISELVVELQEIGAALAGVQDTDIPSKYDSTTGRAVAQYRFNDQMMAYVSYAEGFGPGNAGVVADPAAIAATGGPVDWFQEPEEVSMWELGFKSNLADNRLRFNAAAYFGKWKGIQTSVPLIDPNTGREVPVLIPTNAGEAKTDGFEVDLSYLPTENWLFNFNLGYIDARYTEVGRTPTIDEDTKFANTPEWSWSGTAQYNQDIGNDGGNILARLNYGWVDDYRTAADRDVVLVQPSYGLLNARLVYTAASEAWRVTLYGDNLTDEYYLTGGIVGANILGFSPTYVGRPREYGLLVDFFF